MKICWLTFHLIDDSFDLKICGWKKEKWFRIKIDITQLLLGEINRMNYILLLLGEINKI